MSSKLSKSLDNSKKDNVNEDNVSEKIYEFEKKDDEYNDLYGNDDKDKDIKFQNNPTNYNPYELNSDNETKNNLSFLNLKRIRQNDDLQSVDSSENKYNQYFNNNINLQYFFNIVSEESFEDINDFFHSNTLTQNYNKINGHKIINITIPNNISMYVFNKQYYDVDITYNSNTEENRANTNNIMTIIQICETYKDEFAILYEKKVFEKSDLKNIEQNGIIYKNFFNIIKGNKNEITIKKFFADNLIGKIKTFIKTANIEAINKFKELKDKINTLITGDDILENIGKDFNLTYLKQPLYSVLSNESNETRDNPKLRNFTIIDGIIKEYNKNKIKTPLIEHLCLIVKDTLDILTYKKEYKNDKFNEKIFNYALKEYENFKMDEKKVKELGVNLEFIKKDYIASLIFLAYHFEEYFLHKKERAINE